jgi:hypothetical protein
MAVTFPFKWPLHLSERDAIFQHSFSLLNASLSNLKLLLGTTESEAAEAVNGCNLRAVLAWVGLLNRFVELKYRTFPESIADIVHVLLRIVYQPAVDESLLRTVCGLLRNFASKNRLSSLPFVVEWRPFYLHIKTAYFTKARDAVCPTYKRLGESLVEAVLVLRRFFSESANEEVMLEFRPFLYPGDMVLYKAQCFMCTFLQPNRGPWSALVEEVIAAWDWVVSYQDYDYHWIALLSAFAKAHLIAPAAFSGPQMDWEPYLPRLFTHALRILNVPMGPTGHCPYPEDEASFGSQSGYPRVNHDIFLPRTAQSTSFATVKCSAKLLVYILPSNGGSALVMLRRLMGSIESFYNPANDGAWTKRLSYFLMALIERFFRRVSRERCCQQQLPTHLSPKVINDFVSLLTPFVMTSLYSKSSTVIFYASVALRKISSLAVLPDQSLLCPIIDRSFAAFEELQSYHHTTSALEALSFLMMQWLQSARINSQSSFSQVFKSTSDLHGEDHLSVIHQSIAREINVLSHFADSMGKRDRDMICDDNEPHNFSSLRKPQDILLMLPSMLNAALPGLDPNDSSKASSTIRFYISMLAFTPLLPVSSAHSHSNPFTKSLCHKFSTISDDLSDWSCRFLDQVFHYVSNRAPVSSSISGLDDLGSDDNSAFSTSVFFYDLMCIYFQHLSEESFIVSLNKLFRFVFDNFLVHASDSLSDLLRAATLANPSVTCAKFLPQLVSTLVTPISSSPKHGSSPSTSSGFVLANLSLNELRYNLDLLSYVVCNASSAVLPYVSQITTVLDILLLAEEKVVFKSCRAVLRNLLLTLVSQQVEDFRCVPSSLWHNPEWRRINFISWGLGVLPELSDFKFHGEMQQRLEAAASLVERFLLSSLVKVELMMSESLLPSSELLAKNFKVIKSVWRGVAAVLSPWGDACVRDIQHPVHCMDVDDGCDGKIPTPICAFIDNVNLSNKKYLSFLNGPITRSLRLSQPRVLPGISFSNICSRIANISFWVMRSYGDVAKVISPWISVLNLVLSGSNPVSEVNMLKIRAALYQNRMRDPVFPKSPKRCSRFLNWLKFSAKFQMQEVSPRRPLRRSEAAIFLSLLSMSLSAFGDIRQYACSALKNAIRCYGEASIPLLIPSLYRVLMDRRASSEQFIGACSVLQISQVSTAIIRDPFLLFRFSEAFCVTNHQSELNAHNAAVNLFNSYQTNMHRAPMNGSQTLGEELFSSECCISDIIASSLTSLSSSDLLVADFPQTRSPSVCGLIASLEVASENGDHGAVESANVSAEIDTDSSSVEESLNSAENPAVHDEVFPDHSIVSQINQQLSDSLIYSGGDALHVSDSVIPPFPFCVSPFEYGAQYLNRMASMLNRLIDSRGAHWRYQLMCVNSIIIHITPQVRCSSEVWAALWRVLAVGDSRCRSSAMRGLSASFSMFKTSQRSKQVYVKPAIQYLNSRTSGILIHISKIFLFAFFVTFLQVSMLEKYLSTPCARSTSIVFRQEFGMPKRKKSRPTRNLLKEFILRVAFMTRISLDGMDFRWKQMGSFQS